MNPDKKVALYVAGPCFEFADRLFNKMLKEGLEARGYDVFLPQEKVSGADPKEIWKICLDGLRACRFVIANLDGPDVDSGTAKEIGHAKERGQTVIGWRADLRRPENEGLNATFDDCDVIHVPPSVADLDSLVRIIHERVQLHVCPIL